MVHGFLFIRPFHILHLIIGQFAEQVRQFLTLFDLVFVKDFAQLIQAVFHIPIQIGNILLLVLFIPYFNVPLDQW